MLSQSNDTIQSTPSRQYVNLTRNYSGISWFSFIYSMDLRIASPLGFHSVVQYRKVLPGIFFFWDIFLFSKNNWIKLWRDTSLTAASRLVYSSLINMPLLGIIILFFNFYVRLFYYGNIFQVFPSIVDTHNFDFAVMKTSAVYIAKLFQKHDRAEE